MVCMLLYFLTGELILNWAQNYYYNYSFIIIETHSEVILDCGNDEERLNQIVTYQCATTNPPLRWELFGFTLQHNIDSDLGSQSRIGQFTFTVASLSPFTSNLTFPISLSINNLSITCSDDTSENSCFVIIAGAWKVLIELNTDKSFMIKFLDWCVNEYKTVTIILNMITESQQSQQSISSEQSLKSGTVHHSKSIILLCMKNSALKKCILKCIKDNVHFMNDKYIPILIKLYRGCN